MLIRAYHSHAVACALLPGAYGYCSPNQDGMGVGRYRIDRDQSGFFGNVRVEEVRCGPKTLSRKNELIECHGVVATCAEWATLHMRDMGPDRGFKPVIYTRESQNRCLSRGTGWI